MAAKVFGRPDGQRIGRRGRGPPTGPRSSAHARGRRPGVAALGRTSAHADPRLGSDDLVGGDTRVRRWALVGAVTDVERRPVLGARDHPAAEPPLAELLIGVTAVVLHGVQVAVDPAHEDPVGVDVGEAPHLPLGQFGEISEFEGLVAQLADPVSPELGSSGPISRYRSTLSWKYLMRRSCHGRYSPRYPRERSPCCWVVQMATSWSIPGPHDTSSAVPTTCSAWWSTDTHSRIEFDQYSPTPSGNAVRYHMSKMHFSGSVGCGVPRSQMQPSGFIENEMF